MGNGQMAGRGKYKMEGKEGEEKDRKGKRKKMNGKNKGKLHEK